MIISGFPIRVRTMVSICCSPPLSVPPDWLFAEGPLAQHHFRQHKRQIGKQSDQSDYENNG
jgi:hypothetical protein